VNAPRVIPATTAAATKDGVVADWTLSPPVTDMMAKWKEVKKAIDAKVWY